MTQVCEEKRNRTSPSSAVSRSTLTRRLRRQARRLESMETRYAELEQKLQEKSRALQDCENQLSFAKAQLAELACCQPAAQHPIYRERPLPGHQFAPRLIALAISLSMRIGQHATADVLALVFDALGIDLKVPSHDAIGQWGLRLGVASLQDTFTKDQRVLWMVDHSSQIGKEKLLLIIGIALDDLPPPGETLNLSKMKVLATVPGESWKKEDVEREYRKLADRIGAPVFLLCDGASELRDPASVLERDGKKTIVLGDLKHHAANLLEKEVGRTERFKSFITEIGLTRNRVQQTELSHLAPPALKQKSRFMNLGPLLRWARMVLYHLNHPDSTARTGIEVNRIESKLGWLREYAKDVFEWDKCQRLINVSLKIINRHGLDKTTVHAVKSALQKWDGNWQADDTAASRIGQQLIAWITESASKLADGERAWLSTEILESLFGRFKQLSRQHSKGGFTRLIAMLPMLCGKVTADHVRTGFRRVDARALQKWLSDTLGSTLTARRNAAYHEAFKQNLGQTLVTA